MLEELLARLLGTAAPQNRLSAVGMSPRAEDAGYSYGPGGQYTGGGPIVPGNVPAQLQSGAIAQSQPASPGGGILGNLFGRRSQAGNATVGYLVRNGVDEGTATLMARNPEVLQKYLEQKMKPQEPQKPIEINGRLVDPNTYEVIKDFSTPKEDKQPWRALTAAEISAMGLPPGSYQMSPDGKVEPTVTPREQDAPIEINGRLVDPNTYEVIKDFSDKGKDDPTSVREYQFAVQNGDFKGSYTDWQTKSVRDQDAGFTREKGLRQEYMGLPEYKRFDDTRASYERVRSAAKRGSGVGDLGVIFGFMKMLDPGSTVREGEQATAENAGGVSSRIRNIYNSVADGAKLTPELRREFVATADDLYANEASHLANVNERYTEIAKANQIDPTRVLVSIPQYDPITWADEQSAPSTQGAQGTPAAPPAPAAQSTPAPANSDPFMADVPPPGWEGDPKLWKHMPPEDRKLFMPGAP